MLNQRMKEPDHDDRNGQMAMIHVVTTGDGELLRVGRELQGERGREAQRGSAAGSYCAAGLKTH